MIIVYPDGNADSAGKYIRPTPLISISQNSLNNKIDKVSSSYDITLNGVIVTNREGPFLDDLNIQTTYPEGGTSLVEKLPEILYRQNQIREYFGKDGLYIEVLDIDGNSPRLSFFARVNSINFEEGIYVDICRYSISLTADYLLDGSRKVLGESLPNFIEYNTREDLNDIINVKVSGLVEDFNDTWSIETEESNGQFIDGKFIPRSYRVTRNINATGKKIYGINLDQEKTKEAWEHARDFIKWHVDTGEYSDSLSYVFSSGLLKVPDTFRGYNHVRSENLDKGAGTYSVSDTWLLASSDSALENYNISIQAGIDNAFVNVSIDGTIIGLSTADPETYLDGTILVTPYNNAQNKYNEISNFGQFGINSSVYKRANNSVAQQLNSQPKSISLGLNETNGEITYNLEFDNRPTNYFYNVLSESISVNDTYPGDVFAVIPVIGRATGPILQYIGGRTEYKRDVNIEIRLDYTDIGYNNNRNSLMLTRPSVNEPIRTQLNDLILALSPASEPGIRKYFLNPPAENWSPKDGIYSIALSWVYELNR
jgi:hypothetical protein